MSGPPSMLVRMLAAEDYIANDPELAAEAVRARSLTHASQWTDPDDEAARRELFTDLLGAFGTTAKYLSPFFCDFGYRTFVGARVSVKHLSVTEPTLSRNALRRTGPRRRA